jgi:hypothetical protein
MRLLPLSRWSARQAVLIASLWPTGLLLVAGVASGVILAPPLRDGQTVVVRFLPVPWAGVAVLVFGPPAALLLAWRWRRGRGGPAG